MNQNHVNGGNYDHGVNQLGQAITGLGVGISSAVVAATTAVTVVKSPSSLKTLIEIIDAVSEIAATIQGNPQKPTPPDMDPAAHVERAKNPESKPTPPSCRR